MAALLVVSPAGGVGVLPTASAQTTGKKSPPAPVPRQQAAPDVPWVADSSEIPALEHDASPPDLGTTLPRCVRCVAPVWPSPVTERWKFRLHVVLEASGKVGTVRIVQTLVGDVAARPVGAMGDVSPALRGTPSARAGLAVLAAVRQWQFEPPTPAPMLLVTDVGVGEDVPTTGAESAVSRRAPLKVGGDIQPPTKIRDVRPVYPPEAIAARVTGIVTIEARIGPTGDVEDARVISGVPLLDEPALTAVRQWGYTPTLVNGEPVPVIMTVTVNFSLSRK